jgi:hypothetical protein
MVKKPAPEQQIVPVEIIERRIYLIREHKVMLDSDLAELYQVETFNLNKAVKRNLDRFPQDFMFQLTKEKAEVLRFQIGMSKHSGRGGRRYLPYAFTEQGVAMLSSVLNGSRAVQVNIAIMRTFARLRTSWPRTEIWRPSSKRWRRSTTGSSRWYLTSSGSSQHCHREKRGRWALSRVRRKIENRCSTSRSGRLALSKLFGARLRMESG